MTRVAFAHYPCPSYSRQLRDIETANDNSILNKRTTRAAQLKFNTADGKLSESIVEKKLQSQVGEKEILILKPRIYLNDAAGKVTNNYATPDFAIIDRSTGKKVKIVDAKNGNAVLSAAQEELNKNGGIFKGSSREPLATPNQKIAPNSIQIERTNVNSTGN